jgi:molybdopterin converting factor small subunit
MLCAMSTENLQGTRAAGTTRAEITVSVKLFADLRKYMKSNSDQLTIILPTGSTGNDLYRALGIRDEDARDVTFGLNGGLGNSKNELHDGDDILLFSPMEGG